MENILAAFIVVGSASAVAVGIAGLNGGLKTGEIILNTTFKTVERNEKEIKNYETIEPLQQQAKSICKKWTKSACDCPDDIIAFIRIYAQQRAVTKFPYHKDLISVNQSRRDKRDTEIIHKYGKAFMSYYNRKRPLFTEPQADAFPGAGEYKDFLTFHWAVYTANNVCAEPNPYLLYEYGNKDLNTHRTMLKRLTEMIEESPDHKVYLEEVDDFHKQVRPHFKKIHDDIFKSHA